MTQPHPDKIICYRLIEADSPGIVLYTSQCKEIKPAMIELKSWADENGWTLILCEDGEGDCMIQELVLV